MRLPDVRIESAAGSNDPRYALNHVLLTKRNGKHEFIATDGSILAIVPTTIDKDEEVTLGLISIEAIKAARKSKHLKGVLVLNGSQTIPGGPSFPRPENVEYPKYEQCLPKQPDRPADIVLNTSLLDRLATAITGGYYNRIEIWKGENENAPIYVKGTEGYGVIMPLR